MEAALAQTIKNIGEVAYARSSGRLGTTTFWGRSFIADETGAVVAKASADREEIITASFDLAAIAKRRADWGVSLTAGRTSTGRS